MNKLHLLLLLTSGIWFTACGNEHSKQSKQDTMLIREVSVGENPYNVKLILVKSENIDELDGQQITFNDELHQHRVFDRSTWSLPWQPAITFIYGAIHNNKNMSLSAVEASGTDMRYMDQLAELEAKYPDGVFPPDVIDSWPQRTAGMGLFSNDIIELRYKYWTEAFHRLKEIGKIETIHFPREALEGSARSETNAPFYIGIKRNHEIVYYYGQLPLLERNNNNSWIILLP